MARKNIAVGIDIGTNQIKIIVAEANPGGLPTILSATSVPSRGIRHGYIENIKETAKSLQEAINLAQKESGIAIKEAYLSIGGIGLGSIFSHGSTVISKADLEITKLDQDKAVKSSETSIPQSMIINRRIIYTIPLAYKIDGKISLGGPVGARGTKLESKTLFITCIEKHFYDLIRAVEEAGVSIIDVTASPIASGTVTLNKAQKNAGCVLANIGAETVSIVVYENNIPISLETFSIGSNDITNDIALGLKISLEEAEQVKVDPAHNHSRKKLEEIVVARLSDIFELIENHLKRIGKNGLLPAGIIFTGEGAKISPIEELAKAYLKLPSKISGPLVGREDKGIQIQDPKWSTAYGLCVLGLLNDDDSTIKIGWGTTIMKPIGTTIRKWLTQFLP
ncbi:MAG: cell division protein FtsA [bacterium]